MKSKKGGAKGSVALLFELTQMNWVSHDPKKSIYSTERRTTGKHPQDIILTKQLALQKNRERQGRHLALFRSVSLMSVIFTLHNLQKGHEKIFCNKNDAPAESHGTWLKIRTCSLIWTELRSLVLLKKANAGTYITVTQGLRVCG